MQIKNESFKYKIMNNIRISKVSFHIVELNPYYDMLVNPAAGRCVKNSARKKELLPQPPRKRFRQKFFFMFFHIYPIGEMRPRSDGPPAVSGLWLPPGVPVLD